MTLPNTTNLILANLHPNVWGEAWLACATSSALQRMDSPARLISALKRRLALNRIDERRKTHGRTARNSTRTYVPINDTHNPDTTDPGKRIEIEDEVSLALASLSADQRAVIVWRTMGIPDSAVADTLGVSRRTLRQWRKTIRTETA